MNDVPDIVDLVSTDTTDLFILVNDVLSSFVLKPFCPVSSCLSYVIIVTCDLPSIVTQTSSCLRKLHLLCTIFSAWFLASEISGPNHCYDHCDAQCVVPSDRSRDTGNIIMWELLRCGLDFFYCFHLICCNYVNWNFAGPPHNRVKCKQFLDSFPIHKSLLAIFFLDKSLSTQMIPL